MNRKALVHFLILAYCAISASRDALSELLMKNADYSFAPVSIVWTYSLAGILLGITLGFLDKKQRFLETAPFKFVENVRYLVLLNLSTTAAYITAILAIWSELGAAYNGFIDYGISPIITGLIAFTFFGEKIPANYFKMVAMCLCGLSALVWREPFFNHTIELGGFQFGVICALASALFTALNINLSKKLVDNSVDKKQILVLRMVFTFSITSVASYWTGLAPVHDEFLTLLAVAIIGFALPIYLMLNVLSSLKISSVSGFLFLIPIFTYGFSLTLNYVELEPVPMVGCVLIIVGVYLLNSREGTE